MSSDTWSDTWFDIWSNLYAPGPPQLAAGSWTPRVRLADLTLADPFLFDSLTLVERYGQPDTLSITGHVDDLRPAFTPGSGIVLVDDNGEQRFSGVAGQSPKPFVERNGDGTATLTYDSDLVVLWERICWPTPANAWTAQSTAYDVQTAVHETRILGYITRNAGSSAYNSGTLDRRVPNLTIPTSLGRGTSAKTSARFQNLGQLVAELAEAANLRVTIRHDAAAGELVVAVDDTPDLSAWARFGDAATGALGLLDEDWRYSLGTPGATTVLSAAKGALENRALNLLERNSRKVAWGRHIELFVDQRGTDDSSEITEGMSTAMEEAIPTFEVSAPIAAGELEFGPGAGAVPVGAKVSVSLDGAVIVDRVRQVTTTVSATANEPTVKVEPLFGTPDAALPIDQQALRKALQRLRNLERNL